VFLKWFFSTSKEEEKIFTGLTFYVPSSDSQRIISLKISLMDGRVTDDIENISCPEYAIAVFEAEDIHENEEKILLLATARLKTMLIVTPKFVDECWLEGRVIDPEPFTIFYPVGLDFNRLTVQMWPNSPFFGVEILLLLENECITPEEEKLLLQSNAFVYKMSSADLLNAESVPNVKYVICQKTVSTKITGILKTKLPNAFGIGMNFIIESIIVWKELDPTADHYAR